MVRSIGNILLVMGLVGLAMGARAVQPYVTLASTTSTENSGLLAQILPQFTAESGIAVRVVAVGTGQALRLARNGDADVLLIHHRPSEEAFVAEGFGVARHDVMYNDFVLVGPKDDPAGIAGAQDAASALAKIAGAKSPFVSRGDDSGTHKKELGLWRASGADPAAASGTWYREAGAGMGATLNIAQAMGAYGLSDRATWTAFANRGDLAILLEGDPALFNPYGVILIDQKRHPHIKTEQGQALVDWLLSARGQAAIGAFMLEGEQMFTPSANPSGS